MKFVPWERLTITSTLPAATLQRRLAAQVAPQKFFSFRKVGEPFRGVVGPERFKMRRRIWYANPFLPCISGVVRDDPGGSALDITLMPHPIILAFTALWCLPWIALGIASLLYGELGVVGILFGVPLLVYLIGTASFLFEARVARYFLERLVS